MTPFSWVGEGFYYDFQLQFGSLLHSENTAGNYDPLFSRSYFAVMLEIQFEFFVAV